MISAVIASRFTADQRKRLVSALSTPDDPEPSVHFLPLSVTDLPAARVIIGSYPPSAVRQLTDAATAPAFLQLTSAGYEQYQRPGILSSSTIVSNGSGAFDRAVAEHCLAVLMELQNKLELYRDNQHRGVWHDEGAVSSLQNAHVLVVGKGHIGSEFARLATALGARVTGLRRHIPANANSEDAVRAEGRTCGMDELAALLPDADAVVSFLPSTPQTRGVFNRHFFDLLKEGAFFLNGGRGDAVDMPALREAVKSGRLGGVGLDVTDPEPLPSSDPLWRMPNVVITPHVAGGWRLASTTDALCSLACDNISAFLTGRPVSNQVAGPRS
jgi:phosphoglycerate dehydrogenase-like enzyme